MINIDITFLLKNKTGIGFYVETLFHSLKLKNQNFKIFQFEYPMCLYSLKYILYIVWQNSIFFLMTLFYKPTTFIFPGFIMPLFIHKKHKYYPVIHDLTGYRNNEMSLHGRTIQKIAYNIAVKKATTIITVSNTVKQEIINKFNINSNRIKVVYNSISSHFFNDNDKGDKIQKYGIEKNKYILSVATLNKRKNIPELIKAFEQISDKYSDLKLVLVGGMGNEQRKNLTQHPNIIFTGYVKDEELPSLYKNALLYMYPSLYEGFGIPLIEAQYCGCPVLCSDIPVFREIGAESVEYCEPTVEGIAKGLESIISNTERLQELSNLGKENVKRFSIEKIAEQVNEVINGQ